MATNYITKSFDKTKDTTVSLDALAHRFDSMINNVANLFVKDGPIYHTWIAFQVGASEEPVIFNTDTTDPNKNAIATLTIDKVGAGTANNFTLSVIFDLFNYGQETQTEIRKLDEFLATALSYNIENDETLKGYIQYGYVSTSDMDLTSPYYSFILTDANSDINTSSGIAQYTFKGVTSIATDCNFSANIEQYPTNWKFLDVIEWTMFYFYGDNEHKPTNTTGTASDNQYKYRIDIPQSLYDENTDLTVGYLNNNKPFEATTNNPIQYVQELLSKFPLTKSEIESGKWSNWEEMNEQDRPRYNWFITDHDGVKTWHLTHYCPGDDTDDNNYELSTPITWGLQQKNIVLNWKPQIDLKSYIIRKASFLRAQQKLNNSDVDLNNAENDEYVATIKEALEEGTLREEETIIIDRFDAELTTVGIPADPPVGLRMKILPRILESVSRTKGTYMIKSASDTITNRGTYSSTFKLTRVGDMRGSYESILQQIQEQEQQLQSVQEQEPTVEVYTDLYTKEEVPLSQATPNTSYQRPTPGSPFEDVEMNLSNR